MRWESKAFDGTSGGKERAQEPWFEALQQYERVFEDKYESRIQRLEARHMEHNEAPSKALLQTLTVSIDEIGQHVEPKGDSSLASIHSTLATALQTLEKSLKAINDDKACIQGLVQTVAANEAVVHKQAALLTEQASFCKRRLESIEVSTNQRRGLLQNEATSDTNTQEAMEAQPGPQRGGTMEARVNELGGWSVPALGSKRREATKGCLEVDEKCFGRGRQALEADKRREERKKKDEAEQEVIKKQKAEAAEAERKQQQARRKKDEEERLEMSRYRRSSVANVMRRRSVGDMRNKQEEDKEVCNPNEEFCRCVDPPSLPPQLPS